LLTENELLKSRNKELLLVNANLTAQVSSLRQQSDRLTVQVIKLQEQVKLLQLLHFGYKSEKMTIEDKRTQSLFNEAEDTAFGQQNEEEQNKVIETREVGAHTRRVSKNAGRTPISADIPREVKEYDIPQKDKTCACGHEKKCIGEDITERLKVEPVKVVALQERKKKYVCANCEGLESEDEKGVQTAEGPKHLIPGSIADESLLAWSAVEKFEFGLPFYRQSRRLGQIGAPIPRATLSNINIKAGESCVPLYDLLKQNILSGQVINADETKVQVLGESGRDNQLLSWMWVFLGGKKDQKSVIFQYETRRSSDVPYQFLKDYSGWLQTDDFESYHTALKRIRSEKKKLTIEHVLCWAHVRRRFYQYWQASKSPYAERIIDLISQLFKLEDLRTKYSQKGFVKQRRDRAGPIFESIKKLFIEYYPQTPPGLLFGKAIAYTLDNWELLITYVDHFDLTPSNNIAERAVRPFVIGRKNWLFAGSPAGARSSAILYSLVETAKLNGLVPFEYLYYIFRKIPYCQTTEDYAALLSYNLSPDQLKLER